MAALKQDSSESESEDGATTYRSLTGMWEHGNLSRSSNLPIWYIHIVTNMQTKTLIISERNTVTW